MKFFGLWTSQKQNIEDIIETGIWYNHLSNENRIDGQLNSVNIDNEVFLYQSIGDVIVADTPFAKYEADDTKLSGVLVKV